MFFSMTRVPLNT